MQNLDLYPNIKNAQDGASGVVMNDLICIANLRLNSDENMDETIVSLTDTSVTVSGDYSTIADRYIVLGHEVAYISSAVYSSPNTIFQIDREFYGTKKDITDLTGYFIRTVDVFTDKTLDWSYDDYNGNKSNLFAFNLETGSVKLRDKMQNWVNGSPTQIYKIRKTKNFVYLFNGMNKERLLQKVMVVNSSNTRSRMKLETEGITLQLRDKFDIWYNQKIGRKDNLLNLYPRELLSNIFQYPIGLVKYINGNIESDFDIVDYAFLNEYVYYKDIGLNITKNGIRFKFNELEEICITSDLTVSNLTVSKSGIINNDIMDIKASQDEGSIINKIDAVYTERRPFYDLSSSLFNNKLLNYNSVIAGVTHTAITAVDGIYSYNILTITSSDLFSLSTIGSIVNLREQATGYQFIGKVISYPSTDNTSIYIGYAKDDYLANFGKFEDLVSKGFDTVKTFDLYYQRKQALNFYNYATDIQQINDNDDDDSGSVSSKTSTSRMNIPIRPNISERPAQIQYKGSSIQPEQSKINSEEQYTKFFDDIDGVYGEFDSTKLLYNKEIEQLDNASNPPYVVFSNRITTALGRGFDKIIKYNTFDNSNLKITSTKSEDSDTLINLKIENDNTISESSLITLLNSEITFTTPQVVELTSAQYNSLNVGDCIAVKEPVSPTSTELRNYNAIKYANYIIQSLYEDGGQYYLTTALNLPTSYDFEVYPATEMLFLQELQIWGNPIVEKIAPYSESQAQSIDEFGETGINLDGTLLTANGVSKLVDYYRGFDGLTTSRQKFIIPFSIRDNLEIQKYDIIQFSDTVFTNLSEGIKWIILGIKDSAKKNERIAYLLNLNDYDASSSEIDFNFENINAQETLPIYNNNGNEGTSSEVETDFDNPEAISTSDKDYGSVKFKPVPVSDINATLSTLLSGDRFTIVSPNINNLSYSTYLKSIGEYKIIKVDYEYILCKVTDFIVGTNTTTLQVLKRGFCDSNQTRLVVGSEIQFNSIVSLSVLGTDYSENSVVGNTENYSKFSIENGVQIKSNKNVDISNDNNELLFRPSGDGNSYILIDKDGTNTGLSFSLGDIIAGANFFKWENGVLTIKGNVNIVSGSGFNQIFRQAIEPTGGSYNNGDVWINTADDNKMYQYSTVSGDFISNLVQDSATAQTTANNAQSDATQALSDLSDIANDGILSRNEKPDVVLTYQTILNEQPSIESSATLYGVTTEKTGYSNSITALTSYLAGLSPLYNDYTDDTVIIRNTFNSKFNDVYLARQILLDKIAEVSDTNNTFAQTTANTAISQLETIADDHILSKNEKPTVVMNYNTIISEQVGLDTIANTYAIVTEKNSYDTYMNTLTSFLTGLSPAYDDFTTDTPLNTEYPLVSFGAGLFGAGSYGGFKNTLYNHFENVYVSKQALIDKINEVSDINTGLAQTTADNAITELNGISSDSIISPVEKLTSRQLWNNIVNEKPDLDNIAVVYNITGDTEYTDYVSSYNVLNTYLNTTINVFDSMTTETNIVRTTWDINWENYYNKKIIFMNYISDVSNTNTTVAQTTADNAVQSLVDISTDSIVTPSEKRIVQQNWRSIVDQYTNLINRASAIGFTGSELTNLSSAYNTLDIYINITLNLFLDISTNTNITRTTWNTNWQAYYSKSTILINSLDSYSVSYTSVKVGDDAVSLPAGGTGGGFGVDTNGHVRITNDNNDMYFGAGTIASYLKLNKNGVHYEQQLGSGLTDSVNTTGFEGHFLGDPTISNGNFWKYNKNDNSSMFKGKYFNEVAYVSTKEEFISALDITKSSDGFGGVNAFSFVNDHGLLIKKVIVISRFDIDISTMTTTHFGTTNSIKPSSTIEEITSYNEINLIATGLYLDLRSSSCNFNRLNINGIGDGTNSIRFSEKNKISDIEIESINGMITGSNLFTTLWSKKPILQNIHIRNPKSTYSGDIFYRAYFMNNISIEQSNSSHSSYTVFNYCYFLNNISVLYFGNAYSTRIFYISENITNFSCNSFSGDFVGTIFEGSRNITNFYIDSGVNTNSIKNCGNISNGTIGGYGTIISNSVYLSNIGSYDTVALNTSLSSIRLDSNNYWNNSVLNVTTAVSKLKNNENDVLVDTSTSLKSIVLPIASQNTGRTFTIKDKSNNASSNVINISAQGSSYIDFAGQVFITINTNSGSYRLLSDGTNWYTI